MNNEEERPGFTQAPPVANDPEFITERIIIIREKQGPIFSFWDFLVVLAAGLVVLVVAVLR
ncbi:hypothetical protein E4T66_20495 [Sinimarinibacterium sp. CAU 1509]|uniref:hypothetical protein n=1 Tax=Sinimarinibacterium sp. CAU 1509 TaxID=2562283 RepID=UPI0010AC11E9|nr:hypothetical protein [Sinimarinibacterium sp. CAU 1509]TJY55763.1 hypothetical protein E4T66_20495 [Sinimarinibacterium sp. CAU 1509]